MPPPDAPVPAPAFFAPPADWGTWQSVAAMVAPEPPRQLPPPLPVRRPTQVQGSVVPAGEDAAKPPVSAVAPQEANVRHLAALLREVPGASADELVRLAEAIVRTPRERPVDELLQRAVAKYRDNAAAMDQLAACREVAVAHTLRAFPGPLAADLDAPDMESQLETLAPLCTVLMRLGDDAAALAAAWGLSQPKRETRQIAVMLLTRVRHAAAPTLACRALFDVEARTAQVAADALEHMLRPSDGRVLLTRAALGSLRTALEKGTEEQKVAAARAASVVHHAPLVPALLELLDSRNRDLAELALAALVATTRLDLGMSVRRWRSWWKDHGTQRRVEWLMDGLGHKDREMRIGAQRDLFALTGEYLGYHHDSPRPERDAAIARWRAWWVQHRNQPDLP